MTKASCLIFNYLTARFSLSYQPSIKKCILNIKNAEMAIFML